MSAREPRLARRELGRRLRVLRREARLTQEDVASEVDLSVHTLRRIETGVTAVKTGNVLMLTRLYRVGPEETDALIALAESTRGKGLWEDASVVPDWFGLYLGLEHSARQVETFDSTLVGGLYQTRDYAHTVLSLDQGADAATINHRVDLRMQRQKTVLARAHVTALLSAAALRVPIGSAEIREQQLAHLREIAEMPNVYVGVLPWESGPWPGAFNILSFDDEEDPDIAYVELATGAVYIEKAGDMVTYRRVFASLHRRSVPMEVYTP